MFPKISLVIFSMMVLAACTSLPPALPELTPETACHDRGQCVWAVRLDRCCDCGGIYTLQQVENDPRLLLPQEPNYEYPVERIETPAECQNVVCAPCMEPPFGLLCADGNCREPETAAKILSICSDVTDPHRREWCSITAAGAALDQQGIDQAVQICSQIQGSGMDGLPEGETCILSMARALMDHDPEHRERPNPLASVDLCRAELIVLQGTCLYEAAQVMSQSDFQLALQTCESIPLDDDNNRWQQNACFDFLAYTIAPADYERAAALCQRSMDLEQTCLEKIIPLR
jgi:hypothetical protein